MSRKKGAARKKGDAVSHQVVAKHEDGTKKQAHRNIVAEFAAYFGKEEKLENWQRLCLDLGICDEISSITKCRKGLRRVWVNIYDFLDAKAKGDPVPRFGSQRALAEYTIKTRRIYPKKAAKEGGPVRELLAHIFRN
ncbi:hypothetical protein BP5796_05874 [Coleophoma crateriformis]|uniref:Uncharacterized protein n=1 Tax=Coleophoma crateriformis TaxID=565419 RepID=A0A3D8RVC4_9HELO|nr:hypothetical protein BP5796_05874 [Coleophoma crateriformis]